MKNFDVIAAPQRSDVWFQARLGRLTASRAKDMLATVQKGEAAARRDLRVQLVCERLTGQAQEDTYVNADMARGVALEDAAVAAYEVASGNLVQSVGFLSHKELMAGCSPDGIVGDFEGLIEVKAPRPANHLRYLRDRGVPKEHEAQVRHALWLSGAEWLDFASYCPSFPAHLQLHVVRVHRDTVDLAGYEKAVRKFLAEVETELAALQGWGAVSEEQAEVAAKDAAPWQEAV